MDKKIEGLVQDAIEHLGLNDCFLVELKIGTNKVEVFLDSDDGVTYEKCGRISRHMESVLDEKKWFGEKYILDVSSAGVGRPLKLGRQYQKNIGRIIEIKTIQGEKIRGTLTAFEEDVAEVTFEEKVKEGKKKKIIEVVKTIPMDQIREAKIKVSF